MLTHRLVETTESSPAEAVTAIGRGRKRLHARGDRRRGGLRIQVIEAETSARQNIVVPAELFASPIYDRVRNKYGRLAEIVGGLPRSRQFGKQREEAQTFEDLRDAALTLAKSGLQITRFKGLGEMNADELWTTTMDPARRMLIRVEVDDAAAADLWFSRLMGDEVEPRRLFIEENALEVRILDV